MNTAAQFRADVARAGAWVVYASRDERDPRGGVELLGEFAARQPGEAMDAASFDRGFGFALALKRARIAANLTIPGSPNQVRPTPLGPTEVGAATFYFPAEPDWWPKPLDLVAEVLWDCPDAAVPAAGGIRAVLNLYEVNVAQPVYAEAGTLGYWFVAGHQLEAQRAELTEALCARWADERPQRRRYRRSL
jgi:hypothetical protein